MGTRPHHHATPEGRSWRIRQGWALALLGASGLAAAACNSPPLAAVQDSAPGRADRPRPDLRRTVSIEEIDLASYPQLEEEELGQLRWALQLAGRPLDDWTHIEAQDQTGMTAYRYSLAFMVYFLALEQYHKLPAWSEALRPAIDTFIRKMLEKPVWDYWATTSKGISWLEPGWLTPYPAERDPVANKNIMYSGHLAQMINLYATLYRDMKWDQPGSIVFRWDAEERYLYDNYRLTRIIYDQFLKQRRGVSCEPNAVFPQCNQHPILAFLLYDAQHGTAFYPPSSAIFFRFFTEKKLIDPVTHETAALYLIKQNSTLSQDNPTYGNFTDLVVAQGAKLGMITLNSATANGWTGTFMHAWQPDFIEGHYPFWKQGHVSEKPDGTAEIKQETIEPWIRYGFMAMVAAEVGDLSLRDRLVLYADRHFKPVAQDGTYHYPSDFALGVTSLTDKLLAIARASAKDSFWLLHQRPFDAAHFKEPTVTGVAFPDLLLRRAIYDRAKGALVVSTRPGRVTTGTRRLRLERLDPGVAYGLYLDGQQLAEVRGQPWTEVEIDAASPHDIVLLAR